MTEHYFSAEPGTADRRRTVRFSIGANEYALESSTGIFSGDRLDPGTAVLLRTAPRPNGAVTLLDLGCGYGPIACVLAREVPEATVWAVDVNTRALELTRANAAALGVADRVRVAAPADVPADVRFDQIWSNPPIRVGKQALHDLLRTWLPRLVSGGCAQLVVARNLGADSLHRWLTESGWRCERLGSAKGFRVLTVHADAATAPAADASA